MRGRQWSSNTQISPQEKGHDLLVSDIDLEGTDNLCQRNGLVGLPLLCLLNIVNEDDEVLRLALVVDLG
jgi:hypothetical protein